MKSEPGTHLAGPHLLPNGETLLYHPRSRRRVTKDVDLGSGSHRRAVIAEWQRTTIVEGASDGRYLSTGHLLYAISGVMFAQPLNLERLAFIGPRVAVVEGVRRGGAVGGTIQNSRLFNPAQLAVSDNGTLAYVPGPSSPSALRMQVILQGPERCRDAAEVDAWSFPIPTRVT